jgi:hypothetical protein
VSVESQISRHLSGLEASYERETAYQRHFTNSKVRQLAAVMAEDAVGPDLRASLAATLFAWLMDLLLTDTPAFASLAADYDEGPSWGDWCLPPERDE